MQSAEKRENPSSLTVSAIVNFVSDSLENKECNKLNDPLMEHLRRVYGTLYWVLLVVANGAFIMDQYWPRYLNFILFISSTFLMSIIYTGTRDGQIVAWNTALALFGLSSTYLLTKVTFIEAGIMGFLFLCTASMFCSFFVAVSVGHAGWMYFAGTLLTMFTSGSVLPAIMNYLYGNSYIDLYIYRPFLLLGMLVMCGFTMRETSVMIENYRLGNQKTLEHVEKLIGNFFDFLKPFIRPLNWGIRMFKQSVVLSHYLFIRTIQVFMTIYEPCLYYFLKLKPYIKTLFASIVRELMMLYKPLRYICMTFKNLIYDPLLKPMFGHIGRCLKLVYNVNLIHLGVTVVYIYVFYKVYGYFK